MFESALSPPYDGSEFEELFPELTGVEPEEMVDIESVADRAIDSYSGAHEECSTICGKVQSDLEETDSERLICPSSESDCDPMSDDVDDADELLRYLIGERNRESRASHARSKRRQSSISDSVCDNVNDLSCETETETSSANLTSRHSTGGKNSSKPKPPKTAITFIDDDGVRQRVEGPNRNAIMAKVNRERKKKLLSTLGEKAGLLGTENDALKKQNAQLRKKLSILARELQYVKGVLANQSTLSGLLNNIHATGLEFHSSMPVEDNIGHSSRKRLRDHDYCINEHDEPVGKAMKLGKSDITNTNADHPSDNIEAAGVCLHVSEGSVSLEFCSKCSNKAKAAKSLVKK